MLPFDVRLEGPGRMFDPRPLFFNLYMGPNLFHDMWAPRCVVCSIPSGLSVCSFVAYL